MDSDLCSFLRTRGVDDAYIDALREEKVDCQTVVAMPDELLKQYLPKVGDRFAVRKFCEDLLTKKDKDVRREGLLKKLRQKLGMRRSKGTDSHESDHEDELNLFDQRRKKLRGNGNASKGVRKIELGWMDYNASLQAYQQIRKSNGGGTRDIQANKDWTANDILHKGKSLFFPTGLSRRGSESDFEFEVMDFMENKLTENETIESIYKRTKLKMLRFYIFTKKKTPEIKIDSNDTENEDMSDASLPDPGLAQTNLSVEVVNEPTPGGYLGSALQLASQPASFVKSDAVLDSFQENTSDQLSLPAKDASNTFHLPVDQDIVFTFGNEMYQVMSAANPGQYILRSRSSSLDDTEIDPSSSLENSTINLRPQPASDPSPSLENNMTDSQPQAEEEASLSLHPDVPTHPKSEEKIKIHQGMVFTELMDLYKMDSSLSLNVNSVVRVSPNGKAETGEGIGLLKDIFSEFWETFYCKCSDGADIKVPILRHDMGEEEWQAVGRIICDAWKTLEYFPIKLSKPLFEQALFGSSKTNLVQEFLDFIPSSERAIIQVALENFTNADQDELLETLESHECKRNPNMDNIRSIVAEIAEKEILQEPRFIIECWRTIFSTQLVLNQAELDRIYDQKIPTVRKLLNALSFPDSLNSHEQTAANHLKRFIKGLDKKAMENLLRYATGANIMCQTINVEFTRLVGVERRPQAHTCGNILKIPTTYENFADMREEFNNVLSSGMWELGYV